MKTKRTIIRGLWICYGSNRPRQMKDYSVRQVRGTWIATNQTGQEYLIGRNRLYPIIDFAAVIASAMNESRRINTHCAIKARTISKRLERKIFGK